MKKLLSAKNAASLLSLLGSVVLILWWLVPGIMQKTQPNYTGCSPLTAVCFILSGAGLRSSHTGGGKKWFIAVITSLITAIAAWRLAAGISGTYFPLDKILFADRIQTVQFSVATAICFLFTASAVTWYCLAPRSAIRVGFYLLIPPAYIALFSVLGFMLNEKEVRESHFLSPMSLVTTTLFLLLLYPLSGLYSGSWLLRIFRSRLLGGFVARQLLPYFVLVPLFVFILGIIGRHTGVFSYALSGSVQISMLFFAFFFILIKLAGVIDNLDQKQKTAGEMLTANAAVLDEANKELQTFTFAASHDLQEPLRKISIYSGILRDRPDHPSLGEHLEKISGAAARGTQLIKDILDYSRSSQHRDAFVQTDLGVILKEVTQDFEQLDQSLPPRINVGSMPVIEATPFQIRQLFSNLMSNSLKFALPGIRPEISISAALLPPGEGLFPGYDPALPYWKIGFSDNGEGFEEKHALRIFEAFQRVSRNKIAGSGIGLSLCKKIVDLHGGQISARSEPGKGACFTIILPERQAPAGGI